MQKLTYFSNSIWGPMVLGWLISQIVATCLVYQSNVNLYYKMNTLLKLGYLIVPNQHVLKSLFQVTSAWWGGLFFTITLGTGLSFITIYIAINHKTNEHAYLPFRLWLIFLGIIISIIVIDGWSALIFFIIFIPLPVFWYTRHLSLNQTARFFNIKLIHCFLIIGVLGMGAWQSGKLSFINIRDYYLLSNPIGIQINHFYYRYTLYPAELFKPLHLKTIKTFHVNPQKNMNNTKSNDHLKKLVNQLKKYDYLYIPDINKPHGDMWIDISQHNKIILKTNNRNCYHYEMDNFYNNTKEILDSFSEKIDTNSILRALTFMSLVWILPCVIMIILYDTIQFCIQWAFPELISSYHKVGLIVGIIELILFSSMIFMLPQYESKYINKSSCDETKAHKQNILIDLQSNAWKDRLQALRKITTCSLDIGEMDYEKSLSSPSIAERYWLARAFSKSQTKKTYYDIKRLLNDPHENVICQALYALGKRGTKKDIADIKTILNGSSFWYTQLYAYRALKRLNWHQYNGMGKLYP